MTNRILCIALIAAAGCGKSAPGREAKVDVAAEQAKVRDVLYERSLIYDAEVQGKMTEYVTAMNAGRVAPERAYPEFRAWLEEWARRNPERAAAARKQDPRTLPVYVPPPADTTEESLAPR